MSACLAGLHCVNYPSCVLEDETVKQMFAEGHALPLCAEQVGGLPTPRPPVGFSGGTAEDLWTGKIGHIVRMASPAGDDFTEQILRGSLEVLRLAKLVGATEAILHDGSPTCGTTWTSVYDSRGQLVHQAGCGVLAWLLKANGIQVFSPEKWREARGSAD